MNTYNLQIDEDALDDIQKITDWYNNQSDGLGSRFQKQTKLQINSLKNNAAIYAVRYIDVRCMIVKNFPFMVHYTLNDSLFLVEVFAVIHTSRNPKIWEQRMK